MVHVDGFYLTHVIEPVDMPARSEVEQFLPSSEYPLPLDPDRPVTMGAFAPPILYPEVKTAQEDNLRAAREVVLEYWESFSKAFGRHYHPVECYRSEGASTLLLTMGSFSETAMAAVDKMRDEGKDVGLVRLRLWRPFPFEELRAAVAHADVLIVLDRALSFGGPGGPFCSEVKSALYGEEDRPKVVGFVGGLGGRDITVAGFETIVERGLRVAEKGSEQEFETFGVRE